MEGVVVIAGTGLPGTGTSAGAAGFVGPKPVPQSVMVSPGLAGTVVTPAPKNPAGAIQVAPMVATGYLPHGKKAGEYFCKFTLKGALVPLPLLTITFTAPELASTGASTLSCVALI